MKSLKEGLMDAFKIKKQLTQLQGVIVDAYEKLISDNPDKYKRGEDVLNDVANFAKENYNKIVTVDGAISFKDWWKTFAPAHANVLNKTVFAVK